MDRYFHCPTPQDDINRHFYLFIQEVWEGLDTFRLWPATTCVSFRRFKFSKRETYASARLLPAAVFFFVQIKVERDFAPCLLR